MLSLNDYLDTAKKRQSVGSDRQLAIALGLNPSAGWQFRSGRMLPSDDTMFALARMAGLDSSQALLDLNIWRSHGEARLVYENLARRISGTAAALAVAALAGHLYVSDAKAETAPALSSPNSANALYYGKYTFIRHWHI